MLSQGQTSDKAAALELLDGLPTDRGYDARAIIAFVQDRGGWPHITTQHDQKIQRSVAPALYRQRNLVERFFNTLKHFRRIATRNDKTA